MLGAELTWLKNIRIKTAIIIIFIWTASSTYTPYYGRCRVHKSNVDRDAIPIQQLERELLTNYYDKYDSKPIAKPELEIDYQDHEFYYHQFIGAGGSGQVYLVQSASTGLGKVVKRYFTEKPVQFRRQNYIMHKLNYSIDWAKDCDRQKCFPNSTKFHTVSIFPFKESIVLRKLQFDGEQAPLIFFKLLKQLEKTHKAGIIHNDIKMGNIMVNSIGPNFKFYQIQLIDWNLAIFYYTGYDLSAKGGTVCFYSPEQLFDTFHVTPAIDIWALGMVMFTYYTDQKPFKANCKTDNLKAIVTLVGGDKILNLFKKYRYPSTQKLKLLKQIESNPTKYPPTNMYEYQPKQNESFFTKDLVDVFMRMWEPDPEKRATATELMNMKYFDKFKRLPPMYAQKNKLKTKAKPVQVASQAQKISTATNNNGHDNHSKSSKK